LSDYSDYQKTKGGLIFSHQLLSATVLPGALSWP